jgi:uncharacterized membrane protein YeaQ/YmgE (transglycosylase-associated protein family)
MRCTPKQQKLHPPRILAIGDTRKKYSTQRLAAGVGSPSVHLTLAGHFRRREGGFPGIGFALASRMDLDEALSQPTTEMKMINLIVWLIVGGVLGWIASMVMRTDAQQGTFLNIVVGIVGAGLAGFLISPMLGVPTINDNAFSIASLIVSLIGAVVLLAIINLFRRGRVR